MDGMEILNSFKKETFYEFSEAIPVFDDEIIFIFKVDVISIDINPSKGKRDKLKELIKDHENKIENSISHLDIEPVAYLLKTDDETYAIEAIDDEHSKLIEQHKEELLKEFLNRSHKKN